MHEIALHNALFMLLNMLNAQGVALKLTPRFGNSWSPIDVAVGETAGLYAVHWIEGRMPAFNNGASRSVFGHECAEVFRPAEDIVVWHVAITEDLLRAIPSQFRHSEKRDAQEVVVGNLWVGLHLPPGTAEQYIATLADNELSEQLLGVSAQALWGLFQSSQRNIDPSTELPDAAEFRTRLQQVIDRQKGSPPDAQTGVGLILIGLDNYAAFRHQHGQQAASLMALNTAKALKRALRKDDELFSYREAQFAITAQFKGESACRRVIEKLNDAFADVTAHASFADQTVSVGYIFDQAGRTDIGTDLHAFCMCAEQALDHAALVGGNQTISFTGTFDGDEFILTHPLGALMTDPAREHRNTRILWQTVALINSEANPRALCTAFESLLVQSLQFPHVSLLQLQDNELTNLSDTDQSAIRPISDVHAEQQRAIRGALMSGRTQLENDAQLQEYWLIAPMKSHTKVHGALYLQNTQAMDAADQVFFKCLADQLAGALDRAELDLARLNEQVVETEGLRDQLSSLKSAQLPPTHQVAHSSAMQEVLTLVEQIAPTDVSVLIVGESGVGKEVMANTVHQASQRASQPLVIVDCSAITHSLIDSELFGRVKGAYTGADAASEGRIAQAQHGTLFLDEIGELPLDVQSKLLRFVQEKEVIPVGGTQPQTIDARIICATNRNLLTEVEAGRFRADLYYRLQVVQLAVPPLRERQDDLQDLVQHMLRRFATEFDKPVHELSPAAWQIVFDYAWPGNIRELQNTLLRATLATRGTRIEDSDLQLSADLSAAQAGNPGSPSAGYPHASEGAVQTSTIVHQTSFPATTSPTRAMRMPPYQAQATAREGNGGTDYPAPQNPGPWAQLTLLFRENLHALEVESLADAPVGRWLNDALVLAAFEFAGQVTRSAARTLAVPETTLRRQLAKAQTNDANPLYMTSRTWQAGLPRLQDLIHHLLADTRMEACQAELEALLLTEVIALVGTDSKRGAALMGITPPTFQRRVQKLLTNPALRTAESPFHSNTENQSTDLPRQAQRPRL